MSNPIRHLAALAAGALVFFASYAQAQVIFDNGMPNGATRRASDFTMHQAGTGFFQAGDDFSLGGPATITGLRWWGAYAFNFTAAADDFTLRIFEVEGGAPAVSPLHELHLGHVPRTAGAPDSLGLTIHAYEAAIAPLALDPGTTYLLSVLNSTPAQIEPFDSWFWVSSTALGEGSAYFRAGATLMDVEAAAWQAQTYDFAFQLTAVPEPQTYALMLAGLALLGFAARRKT